jgi:hypothetical protein
VNAYTNHSNNSRTGLNFYFRIDRAWVGSKLATLTAEPDKTQEEIQHKGIEDVALDAEEEAWR